MRKLIKVTGLLGMSLIFVWSNAQITLDNPSFEGKPVDGEGLEEWFNCMENDTPDVLPGPWNVNTPPLDGQTYVGLCTRSQGTWESLGQKLKFNMKAKECYTFRINLARSETYVGYNWPVRLRIWGGKNICDKAQLLAETESIKHTDWKAYDFEFFPDEDVSYILLEAYFSPGIYLPYNGNVLLDKCSPIERCKGAFLLRLTGNEGR